MTFSSDHVSGNQQNTVHTLRFQCMFDLEIQVQIELHFQNKTLYVLLLTIFVFNDDFTHLLLTFSLYFNIPYSFLVEAAKKECETHISHAVNSKALHNFLTRKKENYLFFLIILIFDYLFYVVCLTDNDVHEEDKNAIFVSMTSQRFGHVFFFSFFFTFIPPHITHPPSCFAGGTMHVETCCLPFLRCTKTRWVKPKILILD